MPEPDLKLKPGDKKNYETLLRAFRDGAVCLLSTTRKSDNSYVALLCCLNATKSGELMPVPFAEFVAGNPFDLYNDPTASMPPIAKPAAKRLAKKLIVPPGLTES